MQLSGEEVGISIPDLLLALSNDQTDRVFDGKNADGGIIHVGNSQRITFDSYMTRKHLAEAMIGYLNYLEELEKISKDIKEALKSSGHLVESIAADTRYELFFERDKSRPIDNDAPELNVAFANDFANQTPFAFLEGDVFFNVQAKDKSFVSHVKMLSPNLSDRSSSGIFGPITIDSFHDSLQVAQACGKKDAFLAELKVKRLNRKIRFVLVLKPRIF